MHCSQGKAATDFSWREYTDWHVSTSNPASRAFFSPDKDLQVVVADILENAAFEQATARNRWRRPSRSFAVAGHAWVGYRLRKGTCKLAGLLLEPFSVRLTREESAMRLALEATRWRVRWDLLAARRPGADAVPAGRVLNTDASTSDAQSC